MTIGNVKSNRPNPGGAQTNILRFTMEMFVYRWLLLVSIIILISAKEIIIPEFVIICFHGTCVFNKYHLIKYLIKRIKLHNDKLNRISL
jgi:hypothetical protein